jgi:acyl-CoA thioesterase I
LISKLALAASVAVTLLAGQAVAMPVPSDCRAGTEAIPFSADLSALKRKLLRGEKAIIVALGSSSTAGTGASSNDASYPAVLEAELKRRLPNLDVAVINRGTGGQRASDMVDRIESDVLTENPDLVIWQTGGNDAIQGVGVERLRRNLRKGVAMMSKPSTDVLLMDSQWMPRIERYPHYEAYQAVMADIANETGVGLFRRFEIMKAWSTNGRLKTIDIIGADGLHMVDTSYYCLGVVLADNITKAVSAKLGNAANP